MKKILSLLMACVMTHSFACTEVQVEATDGSIVVGRTFDFEIPATPRLLLVPRGHERHTMAPDNAITKSWKNKYSYLKFAMFNQDDMIAQIINEKGLGMELLWLRDDTQWPNPTTPEQKKNAMEVLDYMDYINGNCASVDEVKQELSRLTIWSRKIKIFGDAQPPAHFAFHDKTGAYIVVEFINGQIKIYDNRKIGVLANSPSYEWQVTNLRNYMATSNVDYLNKDIATEINVPNIKPITGSGLTNKPGGLDSVSRFVSTFLLKQYADKPANSTQAIALADQIMDNVNKPKGVILSPVRGKLEPEYTQWRVVTDFTHMNLYISQASQINYTKIDLNKLFIKNTTAKEISFSSLSAEPVDVTDKIK